MKSDRRILYTKKVIKEAMLLLLNDQDLKKITIKEICSVADINRATFYRHYNDIYHLFEEIEKEIITEVYPNDFSELLNCKLLDIIYNNQGFYKEFFNSHLDSLYIKSILSDIFDELNKVAMLQDTYDSDEFKYIFNYNYYGIVGLLKEWVDNGCIETTEFFSKIVVDVYKKQFESLTINK